MIKGTEVHLANACCGKESDAAQCCRHAAASRVKRKEKTCWSQAEVRRYNPSQIARITFYNNSDRNMYCFPYVMNNNFFH